MRGGSDLTRRFFKMLSFLNGFRYRSKISWQFLNNFFAHKKISPIFRDPSWSILIYLPPIPCGGGQIWPDGETPFPNRQFLAYNDIVYIKMHLRVKRTCLKHILDPSDHFWVPSEKFEKKSPKFSEEKNSDHAGRVRSDQKKNYFSTDQNGSQKWHFRILNDSFRLEITFAVV